MSDVKNEMLTITMTDRPPVRVNKRVWDLVAQSKDWEGQYECQANRHWKVSVRQCQNEVTIGVLFTVRMTRLGAIMTFVQE